MATDLDLAEMLADRCKDRLRYLTDRDQWLHWDGNRWLRTNKTPVYREAIGLVKAITAAVDDAAGAKEADKAASKRAIDAMVSLAGHLEPITAYAAEFDADPWILATPGLIVDLRSDGADHVPVPADKVTKLTRAEYDPFACSDLWDKFLDQITCGDLELASWLQRAVGQTLIGRQRDHVFLFLFGGGANGKGTFCNALLDVLGDYGMMLPGDMLIERRNEAHVTELTDLEGMRLAVGEEIPKSASWNESRIKQLSGGGRIRAHKMAKDYYEFEASHTFWMQGNDKPRIKGTDHGIWRRLKLVPFVADIPEAERDPDLPDKLRQQDVRNAIFAWAVEGCKAYQRDGLGWCSAVKAATDEYRQDEDVFGTFLREMTLHGETLTVEKEKFRQALNAWMTSREYKPLNDKTIKNELSRRRITDFRPTRMSSFMWKGLKLVADVTPYDAHSAHSWDGDDDEHRS